MFMWLDCSFRICLWDSLSLGRRIWGHHDCRTESYAVLCWGRGGPCAPVSPRSFVPYEAVLLMYTFAWSVWLCIQLYNL